MITVYFYDYSGNVNLTGYIKREKKIGHFHHREIWYLRISFTELTKRGFLTKF